MGIFDQTPDNDNLVARMIAKRQGREPTQDEIDQSNKIQQQAIDMGSGVLGTVGGPAAKFSGIMGMGEQAAKAMTPEAMNVAEQTAPSMADRIRTAASQSKVTNIPSAQDVEAAMYKQKYQDAPSFFDKYGKQATSTGEDTGKSFADKMKEQYQQHLRDESFAERNADQLAQAKDVPFKLLTQKLKGQFGGK
jgi:hypothetical protein